MRSMHYSNLHKIMQYLILLNNISEPSRILSVIQEYDMGKGFFCSIKSRAQDQIFFCSLFSLVLLAETARQIIQQKSLQMRSTLLLLLILLIIHTLLYNQMSSEHENGDDYYSHAAEKEKKSLVKSHAKLRIKRHD